MTNERAKSELEQLYMSLSEEKKKALDVAFKAMEQADNMPVMYYPQVDGITPTVVAQTDGEYISRTAIEYINAPIAPVIQGEEVHYEWVAFRKQIEQLPSVAIPPEHDGCKDCKYETYPEYYYPCCECKQNYMDEWKAKANKVGHWIMPQQDDGMSDPIYYQVRCSECGFDLDPQTWHQELHQYDADKFCPKCGCPMEIER